MATDPPDQNPLEDPEITRDLPPVRRPAPQSEKAESPTGAQTATADRSSGSRAATQPAKATGSRSALTQANTERTSGSRAALEPAEATGSRSSLTQPNTERTSGLRAALQPAKAATGSRPALSPANAERTSRSRAALQPAKAATGSRPALSPANAERTSGSRAALRPGASDEPTDPNGIAAGDPRTTSSPSNPRVITGRMLALRMGTVESSRHASQVLDQSEFDDDEITQFDGVLGDRGRPREDDDDGESTLAGQQFDGIRPAESVTSRDAFKAVEAPIQSRPGRRRAALYAQVIDQFAVGHNPRYEPDAPDKLRAHLFIWDVTRAMSCEIPKFIGGREQTLGLMVDWLRSEGPARGWFKIDAATALDAANRGMPVVVVPKEYRLKLMAMVRPGAGPEGALRVAGAAVTRGNAMAVKEAFGIDAVEYYEHD